MTTEEVAKLARLMGQPTTSAAAFTSLSLGVASQAMGIWVGMATGTLQASQRLFTSSWLGPQQPPAPAEAERGSAPAVLTVLEGGASKRAAQSVERAASGNVTPLQDGNEDGSAALTKAVQNAANSAAALGDPETGKEFARKAEAKAAKAAAPEKIRRNAAEPVHAANRRPAETVTREHAEIAPHEPAASPPAPAAEGRQQPKPADRPETPDDLKAISGIGPKLEKVLNGLGIWTYAQLAGLAQEEIAWLEDHLGFAGRIGRDDWVKQAKALAPTKQ